MRFGLEENLCLIAQQYATSKSLLYLLLLHWGYASLCSSKFIECIWLNRIIENYNNWIKKKSYKNTTYSITNQGLLWYIYLGKEFNLIELMWNFISKTFFVMENFCKTKSKRDMCPILIDSKDLFTALVILIRNIGYTVFLRNIYSGMIFLFITYSMGVPSYHYAENLWNGLIRVKLY